jgi:DegV family protein with EDD domain
MPSIAIVTDTDCSLPADLAAQHGIRQVPINIHFGQETLRTGLDIDDDALFARVDREGQLPTTSAPSPGQFAEAYQAAFGEGADEIICFCVSSKVSATYTAAVNARDLMPERTITVVDTLNLSMGQGFMVLAAAEAAQAGASRDEVLAQASDVGRRTHLYAALSTLKYLAMSGRVGHLAAGVANLLNVKPILTVRDGVLDLLERVRTQTKAWGRVIDLTAQAAAGRSVERMAVFHVAAPAQADRFEAQLRASLPYSGPAIRGQLSPGLSVHAGAGMVGVCFVVGE